MPLLLRLARPLPAAVLALLALAAPPLPAQEDKTEPPSQNEIFTEVVEVNVVNVEVYVTDKKGQRIKGLKRDDFEILEDGRPVTTTNFYAVEGGKVTAGQAPAAPTPPPADTPPGLPAAAPSLPEDQRLHLVVYVDNFNIRPFNRNRVFRRLREFLNSQLHPGDEVMLISYDRSLHLRHPFTSDPALITQALYDLETVSGFGVHADSARREMLEAIDEAESATDVSGRLRQYAESEFNDLEFTIGALTEFSSWLAGLPGRKAILYLSDGLAMSPAQELFLALQQKFPEYSSLSESTQFDASRRFQALAAQANTDRVTFYTIDAGGLRPLASSSVEHAGLQTAGLGSYIDSMYINNIQSPLLFLAEQTGGFAIINTNDVGSGLQRISEDFDTYYSLGFSPAHAGDGRYHRIEVKVRTKGLKVRSRDGYRDKPLESRLADSTLSTLRFGGETNPMQVALLVGKPNAREDGYFEVPIVVQIPLDKVVLLPRSEAHEGRVRLFISALDEKGGTSPVQQEQVPISIPNDQMEKALHDSYYFRLTLLMRGGGHQVAVTVRDDLGATVSTLRKPVWVGS